MQVYCKLFFLQHKLIMDKGKIMYAISTMWLADINDSADSIIYTILELGFKKVELEYRITKDVAYDLLKAFKTHNIEVISLHNYFPRPEQLKKTQSISFAPSLCSLDEQERMLAVNLTLNTINYACEYESECIVMHLGNIVMNQPEDLLKKIFKSNLASKSEKEILIKERNIKSKNHFDRLMFSLEQLNERACKINVKLGIENSYYFNQLPYWTELKIILNEFRGGNLGWWYDIGHARVRQNLNFMPEEEELFKNFKSELLGVHLHDVTLEKDHLAPGTGDIDWKNMLENIKGCNRLILEIRKEESKEKVRDSMTLLESLKI